MSCTINASTSAGLISSADTSGSLQLQTNSGTTAVTIDTSQNVGVGQTSPNAKLETLGSTAGAEVSRFEGNYSASGTVNLTNWRRFGGAVASVMRYNDANTDMEFGTTTSHSQAFITAGTERMRITSGGNVGIGTTSPGSYFQINTSNNTAYANTSPSISAVTSALVNSANYVSGGVFVGTQFNLSGDSQNRIGYIGAISMNSSDQALSLVFGVNTGAGSRAEAARITSAGNFCIGSTTALSAATGRTDLTVNGATTAVISLGIAGTRQGYIYAPTAGMNVVTETGDLNIQTTVANSVTFTTNAVERMRINSSGQVFVNATSTLNGTLENFQLYPATSGSFQYGMMVGGNANSYTVYAMRFLNTYTPAVVGSIVINSATTSFNTSSDYRLKNTITPMTGALDKVAQLKPVTYKWNADNSNGEGFIAHELAEVCPHAVTGTKDAIDEEGKPVYQGIDTSFLVATLTAAIQELNTLITAQAAEITALKAKVGI
jgi:hypothetical protein